MEEDRASSTIESVLQKAGLTRNEAKVYLVLNDHGSSKAGKIAKLAHIDRSSCYNSIKSLLDKGLASYVCIGRVKWFQATGPRRLIEHVHEQEQLLREIMPVLSERHESVKIEGQVRLFKGIKGIKSIFLDIIRTGKDNAVFGSEGQFSARMPEFVLQYEKMKSEKSIRTRLLLRHGRKELNTQLSKHRYLEGIAPSPAVTNVYGDKIAIVIWTDEPEGIIIENPRAAKAFKSYFDFMWNKAHP